MKIKIKKWLPVILFMFIPLFAALLLCALQGIALNDIYFYNTPNNDEVYYYLQAKGIAEYGYPQGYFGYNQSHAEHLSFAAWNPLIYIGYAFCGLLFGWGDYSYMIYNIGFLCLCMLAFALITKCDAKRLAAAGALYTLYMLITYYALSVSCETLFLGLMVIFIAISYRALYEGVPKRLCLFSLIIITFISVIRPYYICLTFLPFYLIFRDKRKRMLWAWPLFAGMCVAAYYIINKNFCAPYFSELIPLPDIIGTLKNKGFVEAIKLLFDLFASYLGKIGFHISHTFTVHDINGISYLICLCNFTGLFCNCLYMRRQKNNRAYSVYLIWLISALAAFFATLALDREYQINRHFLEFIFSISVLNILFIFDEKRFTKNMINAVTSAFAVVCICGIGYFTAAKLTMPVKAPNQEQTIAEVTDLMRETMPVVERGSASWENTVLWPWNDYYYTFDDKGNEVLTEAIFDIPYEYLFCLPGGMAVNLTGFEYINYNFLNVNCKYLYTCPGGVLGKRCIEAGGELLMTTDEFEIYITPKYVGK